MSDNSTYSYLLQHGVKPSMQRLAVMDYLLAHHAHPTADEIYTALHPAMPTLSKTTVYNTLRVLVEQGAVAMLTIDERRVCYDAFTHPHAHFMCVRCGRVQDVEMDVTQVSAAATPPEGCHIGSMDLYYRGVCADCLGKQADGDAAGEEQ